MGTSRDWTAQLIRVLAVSLTSSVILSPGVLAQPIAPHITVAQAEQRARTLFAISKDYTVSQRTFTRATDLAPSTYTVTFSNAAQGDPARTISVQIDAQNGSVVSYAGVSTAGAFHFPLPVSPDKAQQIAVAWAKKLFPSQVASVQMQQQLAVSPGTLTQPVSYQFVFERTVNGVPAPFNGFALTLDQNGQLSQVYDQWNDVSFPAAAGVMPINRATAIYQHSLGLTLGYADMWTTKMTSQTRLVYQPTVVNWGPSWNTTFDTDLSSATPAIDAKSGKILSATGDSLAMPAPLHDTVVIAGGPTEFPGMHKVNWTEQQAMSYVTSLLQIPKNMSLLNAYENDASSNGAAASSATANDDVWSFTWEGNGHRVYASVNATRGLLTSYSGYIDKPTPHTSATQASINLAAAGFVRRLYPHDTGGLAVVPTLGTDVSRKSVHRTFSITPVIHGIPVLSGIGQFTVDGTTTLKVVSFNQQALPSVTQLPAPTHAITAAEAAKDWVKNSPLQLQYLMVQRTWLPTTPSATANKDNPVVLVYAPETGPFASDLWLDALTERFYGGTSHTPVAYAGPVGDLPTGRRGASQIQLLLSRGLLTVDASAEVHPDRIMAHGEFVKLVADAFAATQFRPLSAAERVTLKDVPATAAYHDEIAAAVERRWIATTSRPYQPATPITRVEAAQVIAEVLGYHGLLAHPELFKLDATDGADVPQSALAAAAISVSLGMLPLEGGRFNPNAKLTITDAAIAVVQMANLYASGSLGVATASTSGGLASTLSEP